jgi:hypothetical protein
MFCAYGFLTLRNTEKGSAPTALLIAHHSQFITLFETSRLQSDS